MNYSLRAAALARVRDLRKPRVRFRRLTYIIRVLRCFTQTFSIRLVSLVKNTLSLNINLRQYSRVRLLAITLLTSFSLQNPTC